MSLSTDNTGYVVLGSCADGVPSPAGVSFPTSLGGSKVLVKYKTGSKKKNATASGKNGAKITYAGKKICEIDITITWVDRDPWALEIESALLLVSAGAGNAGKVWDLTERFQAQHMVGAIMVDDMEGPDPHDGSDLMVCKLICSGWTKPASTGAGQGITPTVGVPYTVHGGALNGVVIGDATVGGGGEAQSVAQMVVAQTNAAWLLANPTAIPPSFPAVRP